MLKLVVIYLIENLEIDIGKEYNFVMLRLCV